MKRTIKDMIMGEAMSYEYVLDEEEVGPHKGPHVYSSRKLLDEVLQLLPKPGDTVKLTVVMGPKGLSSNVKLYQGGGVRYELSVQNLTGSVIKVDSKWEGMN